MSEPISARVRGQTINLTWSAGPTQGRTHQHEFHDDGTVEWHAVDDPNARREAQAGKSGSARTERELPRYLARDLSDHIVLVSYLSPASGYTLTVVLDFVDRTVVGVASNDKTWAPVEGSFTTAHHAAVSIGDA